MFWCWDRANERANNRNWLQFLFSFASKHSENMKISLTWMCHRKWHSKRPSELPVQQDKDNCVTTPLNVAKQTSEPAFPRMLLCPYNFQWCKGHMSDSIKMHDFFGFLHGWHSRNGSEGMGPLCGNGRVKMEWERSPVGMTGYEWNGNTWLASNGSF